MAWNIEQLKHKAQAKAQEHSGQIGQGLDKAAGFAKSRFGQHSDKIDNMVDKAKGYLNENPGGSGHGESGQGPNR